jgi:hypothetical protein
MVQITLAKSDAYANWIFVHFFFYSSNLGNHLRIREKGREEERERGEA